MKRGACGGEGASVGDNELVTDHSPLVTSASLRSAHAGRWRREMTAHGAGTGSSDGHDSAEIGKTEVGGWVGPEPDTTCHRLPVGSGDLVRARCNHASRRSHAIAVESPALGLESIGPCGQQKAPGATRVHAGAMAVYRLLAIGYLARDLAGGRAIIGTLGQCSERAIRASAASVVIGIDPSSRRTTVDRETPSTRAAAAWVPTCCRKKR